MALPLPNTLSFTSGDPLTAEEMNKMWANDKFLADNINAGKLVIKVNGQLVNNSFDANKSTDVDIDLTIPEYVSDLTDHADYAKVANVPTKTSDLTNDGDGTLPFLTSADVPGIPNNGKLTITVNGSTVGEFTADQATNTTVPLTIPEYVTDLADSGDYSTTVQVSQLISTAIAGIASAKLSYEIVQTLPTEGIDASTVYMILQQESGADDYYDQYMYINNQWAHLGTTEIDLSQYAKLSDIPTVPDVYDSTITFYKSDGTTRVDSFTLNQSSNKSITLPEGGSSKTVTIKDADANAIDSFALNIQTDKTVTLPAATGTKYGMTKVQVSSTDLAEGSVLPQGEIYGVTGAPTRALLDLIYPVGAIYMSVNSTNPGTLFGGTWVAWGAGRVPVGVDTSQTEFNTVLKTGGEKTHTLTIAEMPSHNHNNLSNCDGYVAHATALGLPYSAIFEKAAASRGGEAMFYRAGITVGGGGAHNNLPPYITCYMYRRTA